MPWKPGLLNQRSEKKTKSVDFSCITGESLSFASWPQLHGPAPRTFFPFAPTPFPINPGPVAFSQELCMGIYVLLARTSSSKHAAHKYLCWLWEELRPGLFTLGLIYTLLTAAAKSVSLTRAGTPFGINSPKFTRHRYNPYSERLSSQKQRNHFRIGNSPI